MDRTVSLKETHRRGELALKLPLFQHGSHEVTSALSSGAPGQSHGPQRTLLGGGAQGWALCQLGVRTRGFLWFLIHSLPRWVKPRPRLSPAPGGDRTSLEAGGVSIAGLSSPHNPKEVFKV